jgi:adenylyl-sulfate kinase
VPTARPAVSPTRDLTSDLSHEPHSPDVTWQPGQLDRPTRRAATGQDGATVWLTGLPAAGKSTIAHGLERALVQRGRVAYVFDGDNVRHGLCGDLGFDDAARTENVRRVAHVARLFADAGGVAIVALVSPFAADRAAARHLHLEAGLPFLEVFVDAPLDECERRDPKGLYARQRSGTLHGLTGRDAPYEPPQAPDVRVRTTAENPDASVRHVLDAVLSAAP